MFNKDLFQYDEENHLGYYNGQPVPSVTQLVDILFPMDENIPQERIKKAAKKGTDFHSELAHYNSYFDNPYPIEEDICECLDELKNPINREKDISQLVDYLCLLNAFKIRPFDYEELIFLLDENGELICYGHYDVTFLAREDIAPFKADRLTMCDYKTTSVFDKPKVALQLSIYALAYEQTSKNQIDNICGMHFNEKAKIIPLVRHEKGYTLELCKRLAKDWRERQ